MSTTPRLSDKTLAQVPHSVARPSYLRARLQTGIVHLGAGAFHRAHQAVMTETAMAGGDLAWGIVGASLRSPTTRDALRAQDWLYSVTSRDGHGETTQVVGAIRSILVAPEQPSALIGMLAAPSVRIVTLTVTEKGYHHAPATGDLLTGDADIQHDFANPDAPRTTLGFIAAALRQRRANGLAPPVFVCCDNLFANGATLKRLLVQYAGECDRPLADYIASEVACPNTMVDRIVPAPTADDQRHVGAVLGLRDAAPVVTEPFSQWVIEDDFPTGRPEWERAGVVLVRKVAPYEMMKLRLLNASHSAIAYLGAVSGHETVADAMRDERIAGFVTDLMDREVTPVLQLPAGFDVGAYKRALLSRFANPALCHRTQQIATDGSQKLPPRILATVRERLAKDLPVKRLALVVAAWMRYTIGRDEQNRAYDIRDPMSAELRRCCRAHGESPVELAGSFLALERIFSRDLAANTAFRHAVTSSLQSLCERGAGATLAATT